MAGTSISGRYSSRTNPELDTIVIGIVWMIGAENQIEWNAMMATAVLHRCRRSRW